MALKGFRQYLNEKMAEQGRMAVSVHQFFPLAPDTDFQDDIPTILHALKKGRLHPVQKDMTLTKLTPTQEKVDFGKILKKVNNPKDPGINKTIVVFVNDDGTRYIIDGHHWASALIFQHITRAPVTCLVPTDVARVLPL
jgi:hypothetical protein